MDSPLAGDLVKSLASELACKYADEKSTLSFSAELSDLFLALHTLHGSLLLAALDIMDRAMVSCVRSPAGREAFCVLGSADKVYVVLLDKQYCSCLYFYHRVLVRGDARTCKHVLAARLAVSLDQVARTNQVGETEFAEIVFGHDSHE